MTPPGSYLGTGDFLWQSYLYASMLVGSADVPQVYLTEAPGERRMRLLGFERVELGPGESRHLALKADPRLLARFDGGKQQWRIDEGTYNVALSRSAGEPVARGQATLKGQFFGR
jgi:beta-glucosidase